MEGEGGRGKRKEGREIEGERRGIWREEGGEREREDRERAV